MNLALIATAVSASIAFGSAWQIQSWRFNEMEKQRADQIIVDQQAAFRAFERDQDRVITAQSESAKRLTVLRRDAAVARSELDGLRDASAAAMQANAVSLNACIVGAATANRLLNQCGAEYQSLGERAAGHVNDVKTLMQAWPK